MTDVWKFVEGLALAWAIFAPFWLLSVAVLAGGRTFLSRAEIKRALAWTIAVSVFAAFPIAWAVYAYCAGFDPSPKISPAQTGARFAAGLLPLYSIFVAGVVFGLTDQAAVERGAPQRPLGVRILANVVLAIAGFLAFAVVGSACFFAAGPKAMG